MKEEGEISDDDSDASLFDLTLTAKNKLGYAYRNRNSTECAAGSFASSGQLRKANSPPLRNRPQVRSKRSPVRQNQLAPVRRTRYISPQRHRSPSPRRWNRSPVRRGRISSPVRQSRTLPTRNRSPVFFTTKRPRDRNREFEIGGYWDVPRGQKVEINTGLDTGSYPQQTKHSRKVKQRARQLVNVTGTEPRLPMLRGRFASKGRYGGLVEELVEEQQHQSSIDNDTSTALITDPDDFEELLFKYKQIQERLADLKEKEAYVVERSQDYASQNQIQDYLSNTFSVNNDVPIINNTQEEISISEKAVEHSSSFIHSTTSSQNPTQDYVSNTFTLSNDSPVVNNREQETNISAKTAEHSSSFIPSTYTSENQVLDYLSNYKYPVPNDIPVINNSTEVTSLSERVAENSSSFIQSEPSTESCSSRLIIDESAESSRTDLRNETESKTMPPDTTDSDSVVMHEDRVGTQKQNSTIDNSSVAIDLPAHDFNGVYVSDQLNTSFTSPESSPNHGTEAADVTLSADDSDVQILPDVREISTIVIDDDEEEDDDDDDLDELELRRIALASAYGAWHHPRAEQNAEDINPQKKNLMATGESQETTIDNSNISKTSSSSVIDAVKFIRANMSVNNTQSMNEHTYSKIDIVNDKIAENSNKTSNTNVMNQQGNVNGIGTFSSFQDKSMETISVDTGSNSLKQTRKDLTPPKPNSIRELLERRKFEHESGVKVKRSLNGERKTQHSKMAWYEDSYSPTKSSHGITSRSRVIRGASLAHTRRRTSPKRYYHSLTDDRQVQRSEIQRILTLDDPKEQVDRFLKLLSSQENKDISKIAPKSLSKQSNQRLLRSSGDGKLPLLDNYDNVEMDIDTEDGQSPALDPAKVIEDFQLGFDLDFTFPQSSVPEPLMSVNVKTPPKYKQLDWNYVPDTFSSSTQYISAPGQRMSYTDQLQYLPPHLAESLNPPLPPEEKLPPLPPEAPLPAIPAPSIPPPPPEPHPEDAGSLNKVADITGLLVNSHVIASESGRDVGSFVPRAVDNAMSENMERENDHDEDDDEEALLLREQLLKSLAAKKQQQLKTSKLASMKDKASPSSSPRSQSPSLLPREPQQPIQIVKVSRKVTVAAAAAPTRSLVPVQQPLVISLGGADSSDSESEHGSPVKQSRQEQLPDLRGGLDSFLKRARRDAELHNKIEPLTEKLSHNRNVDGVQTIHKQHVQLQVRQMEEKLAVKRKDLVKEQSHLKTIAEQVTKFSRNRAIAEYKMLKLQEQLDAAERVVVINTKQADAARQEATKAKVRLARGLLEYKNSEKLVILKGRQAFGSTYKPQTRLVQKDIPKRKVLDDATNHDLLQTKKLKTLVSVVDADGTRNVLNISEERERLQRLKQKYAEKLQLLRSVHQNKNKPAPTDLTNIMPKDPPALPRVPALPRFEKIDLGNITGDSDTDTEKMLSKKRRRRSLLDANMSTKPSLPATATELNKRMVEEVVVDTADNDSKSTKPTFQMPGSKQLENLAKLQREKLEKNLSDIQGKRCVSTLALDNYSHLLYASQMPVNVDLSSITSASTASRAASLHCNINGYSSPLLCFRSYRLSPYFRTRENLTLTSPSFTHKIHTMNRLCRFELQGTCNDPDCQWQHEKDYKLSEQEMVMDFLSYCPVLTGLDDKTLANPEAAKLTISEYADSLFQQHQGKMTTDQLCLYLTSQIRDKLKQEVPHFVIADERLHKPQQEDKKIQSANVPPTSVNPRRAPTTKKHRTLSLSDQDNVLSEQDERYFIVDDQNVQDMESAVSDDPHNIHIWLKLAHKKLHSSDSDMAVGLENALNVLSRAVESNKTSAELWLFYLRLYSRHPDGAADLVQMCQIAVKYCNHSYRLWWQLLQAAVNADQKEKICDDIVNFLLNDFEGVDAKSFYLLEIVLYRISLNVQRGRYKTALNYIQSILKEAEGTAGQIRKNLGVQDFSLLWLTFINLQENHQLPDCLYDPACQNPGKLVSRKPFLVDWSQRGHLNMSLTSLTALLTQAIAAVEATIDREKASENNSPGRSPEATTQALSILYENYILLLFSQRQRKEARTVYETVLTERPDLISVWLLAAEKEVTCKRHSVASKFLECGIQNNKDCAQLYHYASSYHLNQGMKSEAVSLLTQCIVAMYRLEKTPDQSEDIHAMYRHILGLEVAHSYQAPAVKSDVLTRYPEQLIYLWLNYCLLLELENQDAIECYETALCKLQTAEHLATVWTSYLRHHIRSMKNNANQKTVVTTLQALVFRSCTSLPAKCPLPFEPDQHWIDYTHHNRIIGIFLSAVTEDSRLMAIQNFIQKMPSNIPLLQRACEEAVTFGNLKLCKSFCSAIVMDQVANISLWRMYIAVTQKLGLHREVVKLYQRAVHCLPYAFSLWKDYMLFEVVQNHPEVTVWIMAQCADLGINMRGFITTISR